MDSQWRRRSILRLGLGVTLSGLAGCTSTSRTATSTTSTTTTPRTTTPGTTEPARTTETTTTGEQTRLHVDGSQGTEGASGSEDDPLGSIQEALDRAEPGQTVAVASGVYRIVRPLHTVRDGGPDAPITITGPPDAVVRPFSGAGRFSALLRIKHSHIHLRGLTFNGLGDSNRADEAVQYKVPTLIRILPPIDSMDYLRDIVVKPKAVGNSYWNLINLNRTVGMEIGEFRVVGLAGAGYVLTGTKNKHAGEIVYVGTPPSAVLQDVYPNWGIDQSRDIHIHHIDNAAGHPHSEIVNTKLGTRNVLIEYCTDGGGSQHTEPYPVASMNLQSYDATVRWCVLRNGDGHGIHVNSGAEGALERIDDPPITRETAGTGHRVYGNTIEGFGADAVAYKLASPAEQALVCGNTIDGSTQGTPTDACPTGTPPGDGIGHLGGHSPWATE